MKIGVNPCLQFYKGKLSKEEELRLLCMYSIIYKMSDEETEVFGMMISKGAGRELSFTFTLDEIKECRATLLSEQKNLKCTSIRELSEYDKDMCYLCPYHISYKNYRYKKERRYLCLIVTNKIPIGNNLKTLLTKTGGKRKLDTFFSSYTYFDISGERICIPLYAYIAEFYISQPLLIGSMDKKEVSKQLLSYLVGKITEDRLTLDVTELETFLKKEINTVHACDVKHITSDEIAVLYDELIKPVTYSSTKEYKALIVELKGLPKLSGAWVDGKNVKTNTDKQEPMVMESVSETNQSTAEETGALSSDNKQTMNESSIGAMDEGSATALSSNNTSTSAKAESDKRVEDALSMMMAFMNAANEEGVSTSSLSDLIGDVAKSSENHSNANMDAIANGISSESAVATSSISIATPDVDVAGKEAGDSPCGIKQEMDGTGTVTESLSEKLEKMADNNLTDDNLTDDMSVNESVSATALDENQMEKEPENTGDSNVGDTALSGTESLVCKEDSAGLSEKPDITTVFDETTKEEMSFLSQEEREKIYKSRDKLSAVPGLDADLVAFAPEDFIQSLEKNGYKEYSSMFDKAPNLLLGDADVLDDTKDSNDTKDNALGVYNNSDDKQEASGDVSSVDINHLLSFSLAAGIGETDINAEFDEISDFDRVDNKKGSKKGKNEPKNDITEETVVDNKDDYTKNETFYPRNHKIRYNPKEIIRYSTEHYMLFNKLLEKTSLVSVEAVTMVFDKGEENYGLLIYLEEKFFFMEPDRVPLRALQRLLHSDALIMTLHSAELYQLFTKHRLEVNYLRLQDLLYMYVALHQAKCLEDDNLHLVSVFKELSKERISANGRFYLKAMPFYGRVFEEIDNYVVHEKYKLYESYLRMSYYCSFSLDTSDILAEETMYQRSGLYAIKSCLKKDVHPIVPGTCYYFTVLGDVPAKDRIKEYYRKALWKLQDSKSFYLGKVRILYLGERGLFLFAKETNNMTYEMLQYAFVHAARIMDLQEVPTIRMVKEIYEYEE